MAVEAQPVGARLARDADTDVYPEGISPAETSDNPESRSEPIAARRADALAEIAETYLNNSDSSGSTADRYQVIVHVGAGDAHIEDGPHVAAGEVPSG